jgi:hypothetical protein
MISREFLQLTNVFIASSGAYDYLLSLLTELSQASASIDDVSHQLASASRAEAVSVRDSLATILETTASQVRISRETRKVWAGIDELDRRIAAFGDAGFGKTVRDSISERLQRFATTYEEFVKQYSNEATFTLARAASDLYVALESIRLVGRLAADAFDPPTEDVENSAVVEFLFSRTPSPEQLAEKLTALATVYAKLAELLNVSIASEPLKILRLESGSWWTKLVGSIPVISVMASVAKAAAGYAYRNFTTEGKLSELPRRVELIDQFLDLRGKLEAQGLKTAALTENVEKASVVISGELSTLLSGEGGVAIDNEEFGTPADWLRQGALEDRVRPSLGPRSGDPLTE